MLLLLIELIEHEREKVNALIAVKNTSGYLPGAKSEKKDQFVILFLFFFCLFVDLGGVLYLRNFAFVILMSVLLITLLSSPDVFFAPFLRLPILVLFVIWPLIGVYLGFYRGAESALVIQNILALISFPILIIFFSNYEIETIVTAFTTAATMLGVVVLLFWVLLYFDNSLAHVVADSLGAGEAGFFGIREISGINFPVVYFKTTLFFVPATILLIQNNRFFQAMILLAALMAATSKTGFVIAALAVWISILRRQSSVVIFSALFLTVVVITLMGIYFNEVIYALFTDEGTLVTRVDHWDSLLNLFLENPSYFLVGQGAGTVFYSTGAGDFVNNIELDHLNSIRKFGILWFIGFASFVFIVIWRSRRVHGVALASALTAAFVVCGTNPVLLTLMFFSILAICYVAVTRDFSPNFNVLASEI
ncbi:hypothetical protein [Polaromonas naphthalenivorans]|uniref:O-antigen polymerase n=1 Tax=Polaromonas naphthalenivorans (strain CJ2) TaxID=365044 RepID=A1VT05_POLNA|nr:hypothetical protein [Polaromonas naphthalenivorans]ABM38783.1 conserved hypothetical protein [Polaromonas naphthalenivorans CJ2]